MRWVTGIEFCRADDIVCTMKIVDTMAGGSKAQRRLRRQYSAQFKAQVARESRTEGANTPPPTNTALSRSFHVGAHSIDGIFHRGYIIRMKWEVEYTDEFGGWWAGLSEDEQESLNASVRLLEERGPSL